MNTCKYCMLFESGPTERREHKGKLKRRQLLVSDFQCDKWNCEYKYRAKKFILEFRPVPGA